MEAESPQDVIKTALRKLATRLKIRTARPLLVAAQGKIPGATLALASAVLAGQTSTQTFAPAPRSRGKSAAENDGVIYQADLVDFSGNARSSDGKKKYILAVMDSFTRELGTKTLDDKKSSTVSAAFKTIVGAPDAGDSIKVTTDQGKEFSSLDDVMPRVIHVAKDPKDKNAIAVIDRGIQTIKKDIAADIADEGGRWDQKVDGVTKAYNNRPHSHTIVPPSDVKDNDVATFKLMQKNANAFMTNHAQTQSKTTALREAGAFRAYEPNARSFNPQYTDSVFNIKSVKGDKVTNASGKTFLLKNTQAVPQGSRKPLGRLTDATIPRKTRYQERANDVIDFLAERGGEMTLVSFESSIRRGEAEGLIKILRKNNITIRGFLRLYPESFVVRSGFVKLKTVNPGQAPEAPEAPEAAEAAPAPAPRRRLTLVGGDDPATERRVAEAQRLQGRLTEEDLRRQRARARVVGIQQAYPGDRLAP